MNHPMLLASKRMIQNCRERVEAGPVLDWLRTEATELEKNLASCELTFSSDGLRIAYPMEVLDKALKAGRMTPAECISLLQIMGCKRLGWNDVAMESAVASLHKEAQNG